jgi:hypothetical protein
MWNMRIGGAVQTDREKIAGGKIDKDTQVREMR